MTSGESVHKDAIPTMALMTNLPKICGTTLNTRIVESRAKATRTVGVSRAVPARELILVPADGEMARRSESLRRKADSCSSIGVCSEIQDR